MDKIAVVINAGAGQGHGRQQATELAAAFARAGLQAQFTVAQDGDALVAAVRAAIEDGARLIVGGGGDGTLNQLAAALLAEQADVAFGVLPLGTLNHFAKDLGIPLELEQAIAVIAAGHELRVDTAEVNGKLFLNNSSLGLYPDIVHERERQQARLGRGKWTAFAWACVAALRRYPFHTVTLQVDGLEQVRRTPFVFVGNNDYVLQGMDIGERTRLDAGLLAVYVCRHVGRWGLLRFALASLFGRLGGAGVVDRVLTERLRIETRDSPLRVATDGEVGELASPLDYRSRPRSLRVLAPAPADAPGAAA